MSAQKRFCQRCKTWQLVEGEHLCQTPEDGHSWTLTVQSRGSYPVMGADGPEDYQDSDWNSTPWEMTVRAWSLKQALELAATQPLGHWERNGRRIGDED